MRKPAAAVLVVAIGWLATMSMTSCFVNRHSGEFACSSDRDCTDGRTCDNGYCVEHPTANNCPSPCTSCDLGDMTCQIDCSASKPCGSVQCPLGFACTIRCSNASACAAIDCAQGTSCDISCDGAMACGSINCGFGACSVDCAGAQACQMIDCVTSCSCDVKCNNPLACPAPSCPPALPPGLPPCTRGGAPGETCDSSQQGCDRCP